MGRYNSVLMLAQLALDDHDIEEFLASAIEAGQIEGKLINKDFKYVN